MNNRVKLLVLMFTVCVASGFICPAGATDGPGPVQINLENLAALRFSVPQDEQERLYLGVKEKESFSVGSVGSEYLIIEFFSMYCPVCQAAAPAVNKLYEAIQTNPELLEKVRVMGIGVGNTPFEVNVFRKKFSVKFPLIADDSFSAQKAMVHQIRTPTFIMLQLGANNSMKVVLTHVGEIKDWEAFLKSLPLNLRKS
jgi:thiol-disulfide isomerase/thioredoxin